MDVNGQDGAAWRWSLLLAAVFLNTCLPQLVLSYGVLWMHSSSSFEGPVWLGLITPSIFMVTYSLTQCWFREAADSWGGPVGYRVMSTIGLLFVVFGLLICAFIRYELQLVVYGIFCGLGSSLISAQVDAMIFETYDSHIVAVRGLCFFGQAIGLSMFPHILTALIDTYTYSHSHLVLAGIMLQSLVAIMFLHTDEDIRRPAFSRYKDLSQTYMVYKNDAMDSSSATELQLHSLNAKCWKSPSDDNLHRDDCSCDDGYVSETITPPPSPEEKRRNIFGVDILPQIPEESEDDDDVTQGIKKKRFSAAIRRLSILGDTIDGCITNQARRDSQPDGDKPEIIEVKYDTISPITDIRTERLLNTFNFRCQSVYMNARRKVWLPPYRMYRIRRRLAYLTYSCVDTFVKPLIRCLKCWRFYPALLLSFSKLCLSSVSIVLLPMLAAEVQPKISVLETNFLISLHGFTWICFLLCTPWLAQTPKRNYQYIVVVGLVISTASAFLLAADNNNDSYSIGCIVAGLGFGAMSSCTQTTIQNYVGARNWPKLHSPLETLSAILLALFILTVTLCVDLADGLKPVMFILGVILAAITLLWLGIAAVSLYFTKVRGVRLF